jgi:hypothetical protein
MFILVSRFTLEDFRKEEVEKWVAGSPYKSALAG